MAYQREVLEEVFLVTYHGRVGDIEKAERMPIPVRRWWVERTIKERDKTKEP